MKSITLLSLTVALLFSMNIFAEEPLKYYNNTVNTENGNTKEVTLFDETTKEPYQKAVLSYNEGKQLTDKTIYIWKYRKGWIPNYKLEYSYGDEQSQIPSSVTRTDWKENWNKWNTGAKRIMKHQQ